ncbi:MAG: hypothetical protein ABIO91_04500 [Pyrinomonadaceae bacterium]
MKSLTLECRPLMDDVPAQRVVCINRADALTKTFFDSDSVLATAQNKKNSSNAFWIYANHFSYNAAGALTSIQLGKGR